MTVGSGLHLNSAEKDPSKIVFVVRQLLEGRSNAVGTVTLTDDGVATTTTVSGTAIGANSAVFLFPTTANAAAVVASTYVGTSDVSAEQFIVNHATTVNADMTFFWVALG